MLEIGDLARWGRNQRQIAWQWARGKWGSVATFVSRSLSQYFGTECQEGSKAEHCSRFARGCKHAGGWRENEMDVERPGRARQLKEPGSRGTGKTDSLPS